MNRLGHASLPLAYGLDGRAAFRLFALAGSRLLMPGQVLCPDDSSEPSLHLVASGMLVSELTDGSGRSAVVAVLKRGDLFGEVALSLDGPWEEEGSPRPPSSPDPRVVRALTTSRVLSFPGRSLRDLLSQDSHIAWWFHCRLLERLHRTEVLLARRMSLPLAERVIEALRDLVPPGQADHHLSARVPLTQELLAAVVGTTRESVNRAMRRLISQGRVRRWGRFYLVTGLPGPEPGPDTDRNLGSSESADRTTRPSASSLMR
jgi:CRP-like cAMP-binding protein